MQSRFHYRDVTTIGASAMDIGILTVTVAARDSTISAIITLIGTTEGVRTTTEKATTTGGTLAKIMTDLAINFVVPIGADKKRSHPHTAAQFYCLFACVN
jgi:hypothetical protein